MQFGNTRFSRFSEIRNCSWGLSCIFGKAYHSLFLTLLILRSNSPSSASGSIMYPARSEGAIVFEEEVY
ncbi:MAG: hypothetical protein K6B74_04570 [Ruminococcus sp.]|nr:hypothetical protein [Ruminococcus sp.]